MMTMPDELRIALDGPLAGYVGHAFPEGTKTAPMDGRRLPRERYPALYAMIEDRFGDAPAGQFRLPDLRDR